MSSAHSGEHQDCDFLSTLVDKCWSVQVTCCPHFQGTLTMLKEGSSGTLVLTNWTLLLTNWTTQHQMSKTNVIFWEEDLIPHSLSSPDMKKLHWTTSHQKFTGPQHIKTSLDHIISKLHWTTSHQNFTGPHHIRTSLDHITSKLHWNTSHLKAKCYRFFHFKEI
jgi:hypothetical protein